MGDVAWAHSTSVAQGRMGEREINSHGAELVVLYSLKSIRSATRPFTTRSK